MKYKQCSRPSALALGNELIKFGLIQHTVDLSKPLLDGYYFYIFSVRFYIYYYHYYVLIMINNYF